MVRVGFICEGHCEKKIIDSWKFQELFKKTDLEFVKALNSKSNGRLLPKHIQFYNTRLEKMGAWKTFIITDSDKNTIEQVYERIKPESQTHILIVSVKKIESWFLSNNLLLKDFTGMTYSDYREQVKSEKILPENVEELGNPYDHLKRILIENTNYRALGKLDIAELFAEKGFDIQNSNCDSARYFVKKLKDVAQITITSKTDKPKRKKR